MENMQEALVKMQQITVDTIKEGRGSSDMSALTIDASISAIQAAYWQLSPMISAIRRLPRVNHFGVFSKLPIEIRQRIWRAALPDPRVVDVYVKSRYCSALQRLKASAFYGASDSYYMVAY